jgi:uncharacterized protein YbaA (DUF1428 family)
MLAVERNYSVAEDQVEKQRYQRRNEDGLSDVSDEFGMMRLGDCYLNKIPKGNHCQPRIEALRVKAERPVSFPTASKTEYGASELEAEATERMSNHRGH